LAPHGRLSQSELAMTAYLARTSEREPNRSSRCVLRRRQARVVVRAPAAPPGNFPKVGEERRARVSTLIGIGAREAMPTLFDIDVDHDDVTSARMTAVGVEQDVDSDVSIALAEWSHDEDETCFDV